MDGSEWQILLTQQLTHTHFVFKLWVELQQDNTKILNRGSVVARKAVELYQKFTIRFSGILCCNALLVKCSAFFISRQIFNKKTHKNVPKCGMGLSGFQERGKVKLECSLQLRSRDRSPGLSH